MDEKQIAALVTNAIMNLSVSRYGFKVSPEDAYLIAEESAKYIAAKLKLEKFPKIAVGQCGQQLGWVYPKDEQISRIAGRLAAFNASSDCPTRFDLACKIYEALKS